MLGRLNKIFVIEELMIIDDEYYEILFLRENIIVFDVDDDVEVGEEVRDIVKKDSNILK